MSSKLKQARLERGYSIEDISDRLNIRRQYLIDLEEGNFDALPGKIYVDGYVKIYSKFLDVELENSTGTNPGIIQRDDIKGENEDLAGLSQDMKYQKYFILASIISLIIIFFSYNIIRSSDNTGINMFTEIIAQKFRSNNLHSLESLNKMDYAIEDLLSDEGLNIDQTLAEEDDMVMQDTIEY